MASFLYSVGPWHLASGPALGSYRGSGVGCVLGTHGSQLVLRAEMFKDRNDRSTEPPCWASLRRSLFSVRGVRTLNDVGDEVWMPTGLRKRCLQGWGSRQGEGLGASEQGEPRAESCGVWKVRVDGDGGGDSLEGEAACRKVGGYPVGSLGQGTGFPA